MHPRKDEAPLVYFGASEKPTSFCCNRDVFCGAYRDERNPIEIERGRLSNTNLQGGEPCAALHHHVIVETGKEKQIQYYLGVTEGALSDYDAAVANTGQTLSSLRGEGEMDIQFQKAQDWWRKSNASMIAGSYSPVSALTIPHVVALVYS